MTIGEEQQSTREDRLLTERVWNEATRLPPIYLLPQLHNPAAKSRSALSASRSNRAHQSETTMMARQYTSSTTEIPPATHRKTSCSRRSCLYKYKDVVVCDEDMASDTVFTFFYRFWFGGRDNEVEQTSTGVVLAVLIRKFSLSFL
jgi:hypothetical protein